MAGYIGISEEEGLSLGSVSFSTIVEITRDNFQHNEEKFRAEIYDIYDNWSQKAIELEEQTSEGFNAFFRATCLALQQYENDTKLDSPLRSQFTEGTIQSWQELIDMLKNDKRYQESD